MGAFWAKGYESTSLSDLIAATGLHKGSLYQAFGDKHSLFIEALRRYLDEMLRRNREALEAAATPLDAVRDLAHALVDLAGEDGDGARGCMALNSLVELAPHDPDVRDVLRAHAARMHEGIAALLADAQKAGQVRSDRPPELLASLILTFSWGLAASMKGNASPADAHRLLDAQLELLL